MFWALKSEMAARYERAKNANPVPTDAQLRAYSERHPTATAALAGGQPDCLTIAGDVAQITVEGVLTPQPDWLAWFLYGNTAYSDIREALASAEMNPAVSRIEWTFASPGGMVDGFFETIAAIEASTKPSRVTASMACSAAYGLAAMAGPIEATSLGSEFGSVGVVRTYYADGPAAQELSIDVTSSAAPNKRPDATTPEGLAVVRSELDVQHELLVNAIARGRTRHGTATTPEDVNAKFGQGGSVFAEGARAAGMIDKVPAQSPGTPRRPAGSSQSGIRGDAVAMAELFGPKRPDETEDAYVERFAAFAVALTPNGRSTSKPANGSPARADAGDIMADALGLPPDPQHPEQIAASASMNARRSEYQKRLAEQLGMSPEAAAKCAFPEPPLERETLNVEVNLATLARASQRERAHGTDAGDRMADAMGLPPEPKGDWLAVAVESLVAHLKGSEQGVTSTTPRASAAALPALPARARRADGKDAGDLVADALGLPPDTNVPAMAGAL